MPTDAMANTTCSCTATKYWTKSRCNFAQSPTTVARRFGCSCVDTPGSPPLRHVWVTKGCSGYFRCEDEAHPVFCPTWQSAQRGKLPDEEQIATHTHYCACAARPLVRAAPYVIAFADRFNRPAKVLDRLGFPAARMLQPVAAPAVSNASCNLVRGVRSLTATHARAWSAIVAANETTSVFEDDIAHGRDPGIVRMQFETFLHEHRTCDLALFGNCGRRILCTHAYQVSPRAAAALLAIYHNSTGGCMEPDWPQKLLCSSPAHEEGYSRNAHGEERYSDTPWGRICCVSAGGSPGEGLFGNGIIGQNRSLPHYLHFVSCAFIKRSVWPLYKCQNAYDQAKVGDGETLHAARVGSGADASIPKAHIDSKGAPWPTSKSSMVKLLLESPDLKFVPLQWWPKQRRAANSTTAALLTPAERRLQERQARQSPRMLPACAARWAAAQGSVAVREGQLPKGNLRDSIEWIARAGQENKVHEWLRWRPRGEEPWADGTHTYQPSCAWRSDALRDLLHKRLSTPPPPTLFLGESNDEYMVEHICKQCGGANRTRLVSSDPDSTACDCNGWKLAVFKHVGVSRAPPYWLSVEDPKSERHRQGVPLAFDMLIPVLASNFEATLGSRAQVVVAHSGSWDSARACQMRYALPSFVPDWTANATSFVAALRREFPSVWWRAPNGLLPPITKGECVAKHGVRRGWEDHVCKAGGRMYACNDVHLYHNQLLNATEELMGKLQIPLLRWDRFLSDAGETGQQIHPPVSWHIAFVNLLLNVFASVAEGDGSAPSGGAAEGDQAARRHPHKAAREHPHAKSDGGGAAPAPRPLRVLLAFSGVLRHFEVGWKRLQRLLIEPTRRSAPNAQFDVAVFTDDAEFSTLRNPASPAEHRCVSDTFRALAKLPPGPDHSVSLRELILSTYGENTTVRFRRFSSRPSVYEPFKPSLERVRDAWRAVLSKRASEYDHLLVLRPDATFAQPIDLVSVCRAKPGFSFVSDQDVIPKRWRPEYLHHSNWDYAWIACTPDALRLWLGEDANRSSVPIATSVEEFEASRRLYPSCKELGACPPPFPLDELSGPSDNGVCKRPLFDEECRALTLFARAGMRIGNLDSLGLFSFLFDRGNASTKLERLGCG